MYAQQLLSLFAGIIVKKKTVTLNMNQIQISSDGDKE